MIRLFVLSCCAMLLACSKPSGGSQDALETKANQGDVFAQCKLGAMYASGAGVPKDDAKAFAWFQKAAAQGNNKAQGALGVMYASGSGVARDEAKGIEWLKKAAAHGNAFAQREIGVMYAECKGLPKDEIRAYAWFALAASCGDAKAAQARDEMVQRLTLDQKADAQKLLAELSGEMRRK